MRSEGAEIHDLSADLDISFNFLKKKLIEPYPIPHGEGGSIISFLCKCIHFIQYLANKFLMYISHSVVYHLDSLDSLKQKIFFFH